MAGGSDGVVRSNVREKADWEYFSSGGESDEIVKHVIRRGERKERVCVEVTAWRGLQAAPSNTAP